MSEPITVTFAPDDAETAGLVASLGRSLRVVEGGSGEIAIVRGNVGWGEAAHSALAAGACAFVILDPVADDEAVLTRLADRVEEAGATVMIGEAVAGNPAIEPFASRLGDGNAILSLDSQRPDPVADQLLVQLRMLRALGIGLSADPVAFGGGDALLASGHGCRAAAGHLVRFRATRRDASDGFHRIAADGALSAERLHIPMGGAMRPAYAESMTQDGAMRPPPVYESGHRRCLRELVMEKRARPGPSALVAFLDDLRIVRRALA